ncbi:hypothetical protein GH714_038621 [Hevea brasiliensis]|uniref:PMI1/PMIR1-2 C-terminal domain-containing protein n=1 Tax=Hevea brasiliensis TaxID=3981 RepID=A0A6A6KI21_HEVBR|nr:hypothetical protein GH714_038621 [Hevea brasiliensis]
MQQVAWEAAPSLEGPERQSSLQHELEIGQEVSEDLAPLAMDKIEALSFEGLRIQSGLSDEDAASSISAESIGEISSFQGKGINFSGSLGLEGAAGLQLLDIKDSSNDIDGLMDLSLTLMNGCGWILVILLRDPLRNYEPVGTPMLALIQVKLKDEEKASEEEEIPQFCISEAHVTGLKTEPSKKKLWGTTAQQQSGSRWLLANGMGKSNKQPFTKSKTISIKPATPLTKNAKRGDKIWSISSHILGSGSK